MWFLRRLMRRGEATAPQPTAEERRELLGRIAAKLDEIEAELKAIGFWNPDPPDARAAHRARAVKSYLDAPTFEFWLQQVFMPNARRAVTDGKLPKVSQVGLMAMRQYDYHSVHPEALGLVQMLHEFDTLVEAYSKGGKRR